VCNKHGQSHVLSSRCQSKVGTTCQRTLTAGVECDWSCDMLHKVVSFEALAAGARVGEDMFVIGGRPMRAKRALR